MPSQLAPYNRSRFDQVMLRFMKNHNAFLSQYDIVKLHVMADVYHVLETGSPIIGGSLEHWPFGPVVQSAYNHVRSLGYQAEKGNPLGPYQISNYNDKILNYSAPADIEIDEDDFSETEKKALDRAWQAVMVENCEEKKRKAFFHDPDQFMGRAWSAAKESRRIDWNTIIDAYDKQFGEDHSHIKTLIKLGI